MKDVWSLDDFIPFVEGHSHFEGGEFMRGCIGILSFFLESANIFYFRSYNMHLSYRLSMPTIHPLLTFISAR